MYLIFETLQASEERNLIEAMRRGCDLKTTNRVWSISKKYENGRVALNVGDGEGLTEEELNNCVETLE